MNLKHPSSTRAATALLRALAPYALGASVALCFANPAYSAIKTWDGEGLDGNWSAGAANWDLDTAPLAADSLVFAGSANLSTTNDFAANTAFAGITFSAGAGAFTLGGNVINLTGNVTNNSSVAQTINLGLAQTAARTIAASTGNINLGGALTGAFRTTFTGASTTTLTGAGGSVSGATVRGTLVIDTGGSLNTGAQFNSVASANLDNSTLTVRGTGSFTTTAELALSDTGNTAGAVSSGTLNVQDSASVTALRLVVGKGGNNLAVGTGVATQTGGTVTLTGTAAGDGLLLGGRSGNSASTNGTYHLNGGTLSTHLVRYNLLGTGTLNLNGGILQARSTNATFMAANANLTVNVLSGGAKIDTNAFNVTVAEPLLGSVSDGGLTKQGLGTLTSTGVNTYQGGTKVEAGILALTQDFTLSGANSFSITAGAAPVAGVDYGSLNFTGTTLANGGTLSLFINGTAVAGTSYDLFNYISGSSTVGFSNVTIGGSYSPALVNSSGVWSGTAAGFLFSFSEITGDLGITAIPEPSTSAAIAGVLGLGCAALRRRRAA